MSYALRLEEISLSRLPDVGGKNASLGEMVRSMKEAGVRVPGGFALTVDAFRRHLAAAALADTIYAELDGLDVEDITALSEIGGRIREQIAGATLPPDVAAAARSAYGTLSREYGEEETDVAVRSSATAEDLPDASFAGQMESFLNVRGWDALERAIRGCMASLFTDRAITYRTHHQIPHRGVGLSVCVQKMIRSDLACSGVLFTLDTESGFRDVVLVNAAWGLGELVVQGRVNPDEFWVHKPTLERGFRPVLRRQLGAKATKLVYGKANAPAGSASCVEIDVEPQKRARFTLTDDELLELARAGIAIEKHYSERAGRPMPMDIEWGKEGITGTLYILQARPETVHSSMASPKVELFALDSDEEPIVRGKSVGSRVGTGRVSLVKGAADLAAFREGDVLVAEMTDPDWEPVLKRASAVVTDKGGRTCHAAIVSRELGLPCVVGTGDATRALSGESEVTVSCAEGDEGRVYRGAIPFTLEEVDTATLPDPPVPLMLNLANPELAFRQAQLPSAGVGLLRLEFLISTWVGVHPMALLSEESVAASPDAAEILDRTRGFEDPSEFFIERLASGVALVAAAFYPRPVTVRFSDFKSNEYGRLLGGALFEPDEANPMIGFRGASRYYHERYREGFGLECRAIARVREVMGLDNVRVMIPFCRTLTEGELVLAEMAKHGLVRGRDDLEVWVMCEIPNNVVLAEEFSRLFDGFSIGSNDLTQLVLGVDRDSELLAHVFDERDPGVKRMIERVVETAHRCGSYVGICGQAPSDYPDFAVFLANLGVDSISLTPDSIVRVIRRLGGKPAAAGVPEAGSQG